jgi:hypothetical protein
MGETVACPQCGRAIVIPNTPMVAEIESPISPAPQEPRRRKAWLGAAVLVVTLGLAGTILWWMGKKPPGAKTEPPRPSVQTAARPRGTGSARSADQDTPIDVSRLKYGLYIHYGTPTFANPGEPGELPAARFAPARVDIKSWARTAKEAGMTFAMLTAKHESGFCLWNCADYDYQLGKSPFKGDIIGDFIAACQAEGIVPGAHYSIPDEHNEGAVRFDGPVSNLYFELIKKQVADLHAQYPRLRLQLFDASGRLSPAQWEELVQLMHRINPSCILLDWMRPGVVSYDADTVIRGWLWRPTERLLSAGQLVARYFQARAVGKAFILNIGPDQEGHVPETQVAVLGEVKEAIARAENEVSSTNGSKAPPSGPVDALSQVLTSSSFTEELPFIVSVNPAVRQLLVQQVQDYMALPPAQVRAHPAAADFPGVARAGAPRVDRMVSFRGPRVRVPADALYAGLKQGWQSTGLYANAGEIVTVTPQSPLPDGAVVKIMVGCHTDQLFNRTITEWKRFPMLTRSFTLGSEPTPIASAFGGPLCVAVELSNDDSAENFKLDLHFANAVEAPYFVLGQTSPDDWKQTRTAPAPWAELVGHNMILHIPSARVRALSFPAALLEWWDKVVATQDALIGWTGRLGQERVVTDRQISVGGMHAGYPFMCTLGTAAKIVDLTDLSRHGDWGFFHELGHNHQSLSWTFPGQTEVTVNFFSLYCEDQLLHQRNPQLVGKTLLQRLDRRLDIPPSADPFDQLAPFVVLIGKYGWEPLRETLASYQTAPVAPNAPLPSRQAEFIRRYSRHAKVDLTRFFQLIGYDCLDDLGAELGSLPAFDLIAWRAGLTASP